MSEQLDNRLRRKWERHGYWILKNPYCDDLYDIFERIDFRTIHHSLTLDEVKARMADELARG